MQSIIHNLRGRMTSPILVLGILALVLSMTGGAYATSKYLITSSSQVKKGAISASDLSKSAKRQLKGKGAQGIAGAKGEAGVAGVKGEAGVKGDTGTQGQRGLDGSAAEKGDVGPQGKIGPSGTNGTDGSKGDTGATGPAGLKGTDGKDGAKGIDGKNGSDGTDGTNGVDGQSAFQLAEFPGTVDQWLASLVGPKGEQGVKGENGADSTVAGPQGPQGLEGDAGAPGTKGADGAAGPIGPKGLTGATGPTGPAGPAGSPAGKPLWVTVSSTGAMVDTNMNRNELYTGQQTNWFNEPQSPSSLLGYVVAFDRNVRGYSFQVTQDASTTVSEYNKPAMFVVRMADPMFTDYEAYVYAWSPAATPVALSRGFTLTAYAPA